MNLSIIAPAVAFATALLAIGASLAAQRTIRGIDDHAGSGSGARSPLLLGSLARLGGARQAAAESDARFTAIGIAIVVSFALTAVSTASLVASSGLGAASQLSIGLAIAITTAGLDAMTVQLVPMARGSRSLLMVLPRLLFAAVVALIFTAAILLLVFQPSVQQIASAQRSDEVSRQIDSLLTQRSELQAQIVNATSPDVSEDPIVIEARQRVSEAEGRYAEAQQAVLCELEGTCGTGRPGSGVDYLEKTRLAEVLQNELAQARTIYDVTMDEARRRIQDNAEASLDFNQINLDQIDQLVADLQRERTQVTVEPTELPLSYQLTALTSLTRTSLAALLAAVSLFLLASLMTCLPLIIARFTLVQESSRGNEKSVDSIALPTTGDLQESEFQDPSGT